MDFAPALLVLAFMARGEMGSADMQMAYHACREAEAAITKVLVDHGPGPTIELSDGETVPILHATCLPVCQDLPLPGLALLDEVKQ